MKKAIQTLLSFFIGFVRKSLLYGPIVGLAGLSLAAFVMISEVFIIDLTWITDWLANYWSGDLRFDEGDIWRWFGYGMVAFGLILETVSRVFGQSHVQQWWKPGKLMLSILGLSLSAIYILIPFQDYAHGTPKDLYFVFTIIGALVGLSIVFYIGVTCILEIISKRVRATDKKGGDTMKS
jgi:hypothetical protein